MIRGTTVLILLILVSRGITFSQHLSHQVMVPAAGIFVSSSVNYSQTIGETAVEIITGSDYVLTQGFQQPAMKLAPGISLGTGVDVYPNPATEIINIKFFGETPRKFKIDIITMAGLVVKTGSVKFIDKYNYVMEIDVSQFKNGIYFVWVVSEDGIISRAFKIEKM